MKTYDFSTLVKFDFKVRGVSLQVAADAVNKSKCQFLNELKGRTKKGYTSPETLAALAQEGLISEDTVQAWWRGLREGLNFGKEKAAHKRRHEKNLFDIFYHMFGW